LKNAEKDYTMPPEVMSMSFDDTQCRIRLSALAENIRRARIKAGLSQVELAEKCGLSQGNLSRIETGERRPSVLLLFRIAEALDLSPTRFLARRGGAPSVRPAPAHRGGDVGKNGNAEAEVEAKGATAVHGASSAKRRTEMKTETDGTGETGEVNEVVRAERTGAGWAFRVASSERRGALP
jgi:transcriptional regulator with XRE-family HTH domain